MKYASYIKEKNYAWGARALAATFPAPEPEPPVAATDVVFAELAATFPAPEPDPPPRSIVPVPHPHYQAAT